MLPLKTRLRSGGSVVSPLPNGPGRNRILLHYMFAKRIHRVSKKVAPYDFQRYVGLGLVFCIEFCTFIGNLYLR